MLSAGSWFNLIVRGQVTFHAFLAHLHNLARNTRPLAIVPGRETQRLGRRVRTPPLDIKPRTRTTS
jgi:hypothetical protein